MKRLFLLALVLCILFGSIPYSYAAGEANSDELVTLETTGELVAMIQTRLHELGYFYFKPTGRYQEMTKSAMIAFQQNQTSLDGTPMIADGTVGAQTKAILFSEKAARNIITQQIPSGPKKNNQQTQTGEMVKWEEVKSMMTEGSSYVLTDYNTGTIFEMVYCGGEKHAEMETKTANDTTIFKDLFGGEFTYYKRPMLINLNGQFIACSIQGQPHGEDKVERNDMVGHVCLYFDDSKSHVGQLADIEHVNNISVAAGRI